MSTYLFYDIETSGLNKAFDQVLQFAAIRTDDNLKPIAQYEYKIRIRPDVVISPKAWLTHQIPIAEIVSGKTEYEAICEIHALFNEPGTISLGYNTLGFDDEVLRFAFYRNLLPPYTHQYANECSRMDIYPMVVMYFLYRPEIFSWPALNGKTTLKLEYLSQANNLAFGNAHDALSDVKMTLAIAERLFKETSMWTYLLGFFNKATDIARQTRLPYSFVSDEGQRQEAIYVDGEMGADNHYQSYVLALGQHAIYRNQTLWLRLDRPELSTTTSKDLAKTTWVIRKKIAEPGFLLPPEERFLHHFSYDRKQVIEHNRKRLQANPKILQAISEYHCHYTYPVVTNVDVDASLYLENFWRDNELNWCRRFHSADFAQKSALIPAQTNSVLQTLACRILCRNFAEAITEEIKQEHAEFMNTTAPCIDYKGQIKLSSKMALEEIALLQKDSVLKNSDRLLLQEIQKYLETTRNE